MLCGIESSASVSFLWSLQLRGDPHRDGDIVELEAWSQSQTATLPDASVKHHFFFGGGGGFKFALNVLSNVKPI